MAGGEGTRLRPLTERRPKPFVPIAGRPCLYYLLESLSEAGFKDTIITTCYRPEVFMDGVGDGSRFDLNIIYSLEDEPRGTAGGVKKVEPFIKDTFLVASGDLLVSCDLKAVMDQHKRSGALATMALTEVDNPTEYGIVGTDDDGRITKFKEKPKEEEVFSNLINAGIYVIEPEALEMVPEGQKFDFSRELFPKILEKEGLFGSVIDGVWIDIGRPADVLRANQVIIDRRLKEGGFDGMEAGLTDLRKLGLIAETAEIEGDVRGVSIIGENAIVEKGAVIDSSFIHDNVRIGGETNVSSSLIMQDGRVGERSHIEATILSPKVKVGSDVKMESCVVGDERIIDVGSWLVDQKV